MHLKFLAIFSTFLWFNYFSQKTATSPFSNLGIGEFGTLDNASFSGIGNVSVPISDSLNLNFYNPASYCFLGNGQPLFSTGISSRFSTFSENGNSNKSKIIAVNHFALGIPFGKRSGLAFGLKPFSRKGYDFYEKNLINLDTMKNIYRGSGSTNQAFIGYAFKILKSKKHKLGLGANINYIFGSVLNERIAHLSTITSGGTEEITTQIKSLHYELGLNYVYHLKYNRFLNVGVSFTPQQDLIASKNTRIYSFSNVENKNSYQLLYLLSEKGNVSIPSVFSGGLSYTLRPKIDSSFNKTKIPQFIFFSQFSYTNWKNYKTDFVSDSSLSFLNSINISFGVEFALHYNSLDRSTTINYLSRIKYRVGYNYATLPFEQLSTQLSSSAFTFGLSFPIVSQRSVSSLNLGISYGNRGIKDPAGLNEKFFGLNFGIIIAPGNYDRWFRKYKID
jgi:hypothetical protein